MKWVFGITIAIVIAGASLAWAESQQCTKTNIIPERYILVVCPDTDITNFDEKIAAKSAEETRKKEGVEVLQIAFYAPGKKPGEGIFAISSAGDDSDGPFTEVINHEEGGKFFEKFFGYPIKPKELWQIYDDNEVVADEDFKGKPLIMEIKNTGLAKDALGKPYINVPVDKTGLYGLHIFFDKKDPVLRKLKKGQKLGIVAKPKKFIMKNVIMDGEVIKINDKLSMMLDANKK